MKDRTLIITGLIIFIALVTFPFWSNMGKASPPPDLVLTPKAKAAGACVMPTEYMRTNHMRLLDQWRTSVVRDGKRIFVNSQGKAFNISLTDTCLDCHSNKVEFCDRCHDYASASPYCWDCHSDQSKEKK